MSSLKTMHNCYLEQMGVWGMRSSLTISLMQNDKLWGMLCAHGRGPMRLGAHPRLAAEMLCQAFSARLTVLGEQTRVLQHLRAARIKLNIAHNLASAGAAALCSPGSSVLGLCEPDTLGCCVVVGAAGKEQVVCDGETPGEEAALAIAQALAQRLAPGQAAAAVQALSELPLPPAALALPKALRSAGCLYAPAPGGGGAILVFRPGELPAARWSAPARPARPARRGRRLHARRGGG